MNPVQQATPMPALYLTACIAQRNMSLARIPQVSAFFVKESVSRHDERPKANNGDARHQLILVRRQTGGILIQPLPAFAAFRLRVINAQRAIAFQTAGDEEPPVTCGFPDAFAAKLTIDQDMGLGVGHRVELADRGFHQVNLARKRHTFAVTRVLLTVHLWEQRTAATQQHIQTLHQTVPGDALFMAGRVVRAQTAHRFALRLVLRRVIPNQITCHDGFPGATLPFRALAALARMFTLDRFGQLFMKAFGPGSSYFGCRPRRPAQKPRQPTQTLSVRDLAQQPAQRMGFLAQH